MQSIVDAYYLSSSTSTVLLRDDVEFACALASFASLASLARIDADDMFVGTYVRVYAEKPRREMIAFQ